MEEFFFYLLKSSIWLAGFALVYFLFLRNERFFKLNRIFLLSGIILSLALPLFTLHYTVVIPVAPTLPAMEVSEPQFQATTLVEESHSTYNLLLVMYLAGIIFISIRILGQTLSIFRTIKKSGTYQSESFKLIRTAKYPSSFSFISFVFINPSIDETEMREIVNHEKEHIRQKHWIDLLLFEIIRAILWFNPIAWLYGHLIRQNHEYLADEYALMNSANPAIYRAALLNQMFGGPVISLTNSFNYSLNKKRFNMMKNTIKSPLRKLKLLIVFPLIAVVFYAFATPEYQFSQKEAIDSPKEYILSQTDDTITGKAIDKIENTDTLMANSEIDEKSILYFVDDKEVTSVEFEKIDQDKIESVEILKREFAIAKYGEKAKDGAVVITLKNEDSSYFSQNFNSQANAISKLKAFDNTENHPLIVINGVIAKNQDPNNLSPEAIESISVLKNKSATNLYGERGKNGVILIKTKEGIPIAKNNPAKSYAIGYNNYLGKNSNLFQNSKNRIYLRSNSTSNINPLIVIDGVISENQTLDNIDPESIHSVAVYKNSSRIEKYGDQAKDGVIEITLKPKVEVQPEFPGGKTAMQSFINETMKYPADAVEKGIIGQVFVKFVIEKDGSITNAKISRGVHPSLDKEAIRIVESMPNWIPARKDGENVDVDYEIPVKFRLEPSIISKEKLATYKASKIGNIEWQNNKIYSIDELNILLGIKKGDEYSKEKLENNINEQVSGLYLDNGYLFFDINKIEMPQKDGSVDLKFIISEGKQYKIGKIEINGNKEVPLDEIKKKIGLKSGDLYSKTKLTESINALKMLDKFVPDDIYPEVIPEHRNGKYGKVNLVFNLTEK